MRGGRRPGAGRPKGARNKLKHLAPPPASAEDRELRDRVAQCVASGMAIADIAVALNVTEIELRARCAHELLHGKAIVRAQLLAALAEAAAKGNSGAAKVLLGLMGGADDPAEDDAPTAHIAAALRLLPGGKP